MSRIPVFLTVICILILKLNLSGQTDLAPGDIAFITLNADGDENFDFISFVDIEANTVIKFTDNAWNGLAMNSNEGQIVFTANQIITKGTIISFTGEEDNQFVKSGNFNISSSGDNILVYQGDDENPNFLLGVAWAKGVNFGTSWIETGEPTTNNSYLPDGLSESTFTAINLGKDDNYQYIKEKGTTGIPIEIIGKLANSENYKSNNDSAYPAFDKNFIINLPGNPVVTILSTEFSDQPIPQGTIGHVIYKFEIKVEENSTTLNGFPVDIDGNFSNTDISKLSVILSSDNQLDKSDQTLKTFNQIVTNSKLTLSDLNILMPTNSTSWFFITVDIDETANLDRTFSVGKFQTDDFIFSNTVELSCNCPAGNEFSISKMPLYACNENFETDLANWKNNENWTIDNENAISGFSSMKHNGEGSSSDYISILPETDLMKGSDIYWQFVLKNGNWSPSTSNKFWLWIMADTEYLASENITGYAVGVNMETSDRLISLWYVENGESKERLIKSAIEWKENMEAGIKVTRSQTGEWNLYIDENGGFDNLKNSGKTNKQELPMNYFSGLYFEYTSTRAGQLWFDAYTIECIDTPPVVYEIKYLGNNIIGIDFSETINNLLASNIKNYTIQGISILEASVSKIDDSMVELKCDDFAAGDYLITIKNIEDQNGNAIETETINFSYIPPVEFGDVVINEIMADVNPVPEGLPEEEFLELYNPNNYEIELNNWTLSIGTSKEIVFGESTIKANDYLIICREEAIDDFAEFGNVSGILPSNSLTNNGTQIALKTVQNILIDSLVYDISWYYDNEKDNGGWSLERIDPERFCGNAGNWSASTNENGGTPGVTNSIKASNPDDINPKIEYVTTINNYNLKIKFSETIDKEMILNPGNYSVDNGIGNPANIIINDDEVSIILEFKTEFQENNTYQINIENLVDLCGNSLQDGKSEFVYFNAGLNDVVINEIMTDESPSIGLPEYEYIEIYNNTDYTIDLTEWTLTIGTKVIKFESGMIATDEYLTICRPEAKFWLAEFGKTLEVENLPAMKNSEDILVLKDREGTTISVVSYSELWHDNDYKADGGWSLERIDPDNPSPKRDNWASSQDLKGGTPGKINSVDTENPDNSSPTLLRTAIVAENKLRLYFSEPIDSLSLANKNLYEIDNLSGAITEILPYPPLFETVTLVFDSDFEAKAYSITINGNVTDWAGNSTESNLSAEFTLPVDVEVSDIVINELLFNPFSGGKDFVEIYNRSTKVIDLKDIRLASKDETGELKNVCEISDEPYLISPEQYFVLTSDKEDIKERYFNENPDNIIQMGDFPSFADTEGRVVLIDKSTNLIDDFEYNEDMHFKLITNTEGVSLERVNPDRPTNEISNWQSASEASGFATPTYKNSQFSDKGISDNQGITIEPEIFSPDNDGYDDLLFISYKYDNPGYTANVKIYDSRGRLVKHLINNELLGTEGTFKWDGLNAGNDKARIGIYIIYIEIFNIDGKVEKLKKTCVLGGKL